MTLRTRVILIRGMDVVAAGLLLLTIGKHGTAAEVFRLFTASFLVCGLFAIPRSPALRCPGCGKPLGFSLYVRSTCRRCGFRFIDWRG